MQPWRNRAGVELTVLIFNLSPDLLSGLVFVFVFVFELGINVPFLFCTFKITFLF